MSTSTTDRPWERLAQLVNDSQRPALREFIDSLAGLDTALAVSRLSDAERVALLELIEPGEAVDLIDQIPEVQAVEALEGVSPRTAARILEELPSDQQADLIGDLKGDEAEAILAEMPQDQAHDVRELAAYPEGTAGSLMGTECLKFDHEWTVEQVVADLQDNAEHYAKYDVQYGYVCDAEARLVGVIRLRDLLMAPRHRRIASLMIREPLRVRSDEELADLVAFFKHHPLLGIPVVDEEETLLGVLHRTAVKGAVAEESEEAYRRSQGIVGGEELRGMPLLLRSKRRLGWLSVNIVLNVLAASIIAAYEETLQSVIALAVFLPIISDMSGCSGSQAVAVSIRELTLGVIQPRDVLRVLSKELWLGMINGATLGLLIGAVAWAWKGNAWLGLIVGTALAVNTIIAVCIGGAVPLALRSLGKDPALASGPILTTVTDACGFLIVLSLASAFMYRIA